MLSVERRPPVSQPRSVPEDKAAAPRARIAIAHGTILRRDAIGHDIFGMAAILAECGFAIALIADHVGAGLPDGCTALSVEEAVANPDFVLLIYHHSIFWRNGEALLRAVTAPRLLKYHNVTPSEFFASYSPYYAELCREGRAQTRRLVELFRRADRFTADSPFNAAELAACGARDVAVVPPFTTVKVCASRRDTMPSPPYRILFVGRLAPNKGHLALLDTVAAYVAAHGPGIRLQIAGSGDSALGGYRDHLEDQIDRLDIRRQVELLGAVDDANLRDLFGKASVYLCLSEHEGFCVPIIEAQAAGLPVVACDTAALGETIGPDQLIVPAPQSRAEFLHVAGLIHAVCTEPLLRQAVIRAGYRNVLNRFTAPRIADRFMAALAPLLEPAA
jgi:glycosyltransferase involved in cell wall biosynthesis